MSKDNLQERFGDEFSYDCDGSGCIHGDDFLMKKTDKGQEYDVELRDRLLKFIRRETRRAKIAKSN